MRTFLKWLLVVVVVIALAFVVFYFWASRPVYDSDSYVQIRSYAAAPLPALPDTLIIATYNIGYLSGLVNNRPIRESEDFYAGNLASARDLLASIDADVVGFQEIDFASRRSYDFHQMDSLATSLGYAAGGMAVNWDVRYVPFPYGMPRVHFGRILSGQAVLSRFAVSHHERIVLQKPPNPFWYNAFYLDRLAQVVYLDTDPRLAVINVHLEAFHRGTREEQAGTLLTLVDSLAAEHAVLLVGDFNAVPSELYDSNSVSAAEAEQRAGEQTMEILTAHEILAAVYSSDVMSVGESATFPADEPRIKIDHILYDTRYFRPIEASVHDAPGPPADHRPVVAKFVMVDEPAP